jgi:hypothetical protein
LHSIVPTLPAAADGDAGGDALPLRGRR